MVTAVDVQEDCGECALVNDFVKGPRRIANTILALEKSGADYRLEVALPPQFAKYMIYKGSIAIDGISLTAAEVLENSFVVWIIPHTLAVTNLSARKPGEPVNLEFDLLAKYIERLTQGRA